MGSLSQPVTCVWCSRVGTEDYVLAQPVHLPGETYPAVWVCSDRKRCDAIREGRVRRAFRDGVWPT